MKALRMDPLTAPEDASIDEKARLVLEHVAKMHFAIAENGESWLAVYVPSDGIVRTLVGRSLEMVISWLDENALGADVDVYKLVTRQ